jgi:tungstate transport system substrate-binding protein
VGQDGGALREVILATTTSTQDSGLLGYLLPEFEKSSGIRVKVIAVGTGEALALGARGDADVLLVHARAAEDEFMAKGNGLLRLDVMHNDFLVVGPSADPAKAKGDKAASAFRKIHDASSPFASRGDKSGTHKKEQEIWKEASLDPTGKPWLLSTGQGMGETARIASEKQAYLLIDRGTWMTMKSSLQLAVISEGDASLNNPYGVIVVSAGKFPKVHDAEAKELAQWLVSADAQRRIGEFGKDKHGQALFVPDALPESRR